MSTELGEISSSATDPAENLAELEELSPVDGTAAWRFLFAATMVEAVLWGLSSLSNPQGISTNCFTAFPLAFGVFQNYYSSLPEFRGNGNIAIIGTVPTSMFYLGALFITPVIQKYPRCQRPMVVIGWAICVVALLSASFANTVSLLIVTQGFIYGTGFLLLYPSILSMLNEWFLRRRGLAYGILYAGAGVSGVGYPFILQALLSKYGYRTTLRATATGQAILVGLMLPLLKGRLPAAGAGSFRKIDTSFLRKPLFYVYALSNLFQGFAFFIPGLYLPSFASLLGYSRLDGAILLALNNVAQVLGQVAFGHVSDRMDNVLTLVFLSSFMSAVAALLLWGLARTLVTLIFFSLIYGLFAGGYVVLWQRFGTALTEDPRTVYNLMAFGKGVGNIATGPISVALLTKPIVAGYGMGKYEPLILFLGAFMFCSSLGVIGWPLKKRREFS